MRRINAGEFVTLDRPVRTGMDMKTYERSPGTLEPGVYKVWSGGSAAVMLESNGKAFTVPVTYLAGGAS